MLTQAGKGKAVLGLTPVRFVGCALKVMSCMLHSLLHMQGHECVDGENHLVRCRGCVERSSA